VEMGKHCTEGLTDTDAHKFTEQLPVNFMLLEILPNFERSKGTIKGEEKNCKWNGFASGNEKQFWTLPSSDHFQISHPTHFTSGIKCQLEKIVFIGLFTFKSELVT